MSEQVKKRIRVVSFRNQRVGWTLLIFTIVFIFTSSILWNHVNGIIEDGTYRALAKVGLLLLPLVTLMMTLWELFVDDDEYARVHKSHPTVIRLKNFCFYGAIALALCEVVHVGGILTFESSGAEQKATIAAIGEAQAKIAGATTAAAIEASGKQAQQMNASGQRKSAAAMIKGGGAMGKTATDAAMENVSKAAGSVRATSFLPDWYIGGGMYVALPALALIAFALTMIFARKAAPHVDRDDDGKPDRPKSRKVEIEEVEEAEDWTPEEKAEIDRQTRNLTEEIRCNSQNGNVPKK